MNNKIHSCLWFDGQGKEAAEFYCSIFPDSKITTDTPMVILFEIEGKKVMALNGGSHYEMNPAISFYVSCSSVEEIDHYYNQLVQGGNAIFALDKYPWSERYAWVSDRFGTSWQLILSPLHHPAQKICTSLLFTGAGFGKASAAMDFYTSVFPDSRVLERNLYPAGNPDTEGKLMFGQFSINDEIFVAMDGQGAHEFSFTPGNSIVVDCETQEEIDNYWAKLTEGGKEVRCGWLEDKFNVSWQIIPEIIGSLLTDPERSKRVMAVVQKQVKLNIREMIEA